jgi:hypothetical protein
MIFLAALLMLAGTSDIRAADAPQTLPNGLTKVENAKVTIAYARPGTDWSKYKTIQLKTLVVPPQARNAVPSGTTPQFGESYVLRDKDVAALQDAYDKAMREALTRAGYVFVDTPGDDTLIVAAEVMDIRLNAPIESSRVGYATRSVTFSKGGGSMTVGAVFADGATGQVIAEAVDRRYPASVWGINNNVSNMAQARQAFAYWAQQLRDRLSEKQNSAK